jgi:tetratricopeptide (TPR) repeat protein
VIRFWGVVLGMCVAAYGGAGVWLSHRAADAVREKFCAVWLCPLEFSPDREYELHRESLGNQKAEAAREFAREVESDAASAFAWANLGEVLAADQQSAMAGYCMERAVEAGPHSPAILMRAANVSLGRRRYGQAIEYLRRILEDPDVRQFYPGVFLTYGRTGLGWKELIERGVPAKAWAAEGLFEYLMGTGRTADAAEAWGWIVKQGLENDGMAAEYIRFLEAHGEQGEAADAWAELNAKNAPEYRRTNWVFNGGFEEAPRGVPLDWTLEGGEDVEVSRGGEAREGKKSLEVSFEGLENVQFEGVHQEAMVGPGKWRVKAMVRTDGITTDEGVALRVTDAEQSGRLDVTTPALTGTRDWTSAERVFEVGPETRVVRVEVFRRASQRFDNKIAGRAWVDAVELSPVSPVR